MEPTGKKMRLLKLGGQIRSLREERNWSQRDLEAYSGVAQPNISQIEVGDRDPSASTLMMLSDAFEQDIQIFHEKQ